MDDEVIEVEEEEEEHDDEDGIPEEEEAGRMLEEDEEEEEGSVQRLCHGSVPGPGWTDAVCGVRGRQAAQLVVCGVVGRIVGVCGVPGARSTPSFSSHCSGPASSEACRAVAKTQLSMPYRGTSTPTPFGLTIVR